MAVLYTTVAKEAHVEQTINKSRFLAHIKPVFSREEAEEYIRQIRAQYRDATHNVPAFVIGDKQQIQWGSDDGEPSGTSGTPMAVYLAKEGLTNVVVVVTRWFGGIKLGPGGLVRAYTGSARMAVEAAGRLEVREYKDLRISIDYSLLGKLQTLEKNMPFAIKDISYTDKVQLTLCFEPEAEKEVLAALSELCGGIPEQSEK